MLVVNVLCGPRIAGTLVTPLAWGKKFVKASESEKNILEKAGPLTECLENCEQTCQNV